MQAFDDITFSDDGGSPCGNVQDIRKQWAIHEDEALAQKLQNEEISQHYAGNRTRNAIVREDAPKAREEQKKEEQEALEQRLKHLSLLQRQAEEDARVAQKLAKRYEAQIETKACPSQNGDSGSDVDLQSVDFAGSQQKRVDLSLLGAACLPGTSAAARNEESRKRMSGTSSGMDEEDLRQLQEEKDAEMAKKLQEEIEQYERDKRLAIEAQDREVAKMLHEKERARLKRAKERARLKQEAAALNRSELDNPSSQDTSSDTASELTRTPTRRTPDEDLGFFHSPPRIPEKSNEGFLGFKANPKKLPPNPSPHIPTPPGPSILRSRRGKAPEEEPAPPYMPIHGFNRSNISPRRPQ